ncbi:MAG: sigma 54-interacting transcriptional regulator [Burkholderiales bacterium]|nr:sigma 54-interacting transcriptional regulator [Burkholderiales bacterium]
MNELVSTALRADGTMPAAERARPAEGGLADIVGRSAALAEILQKASRVSRTDAAVLICGETGTGKELVAQAIHRLSPRRDRPLVKVNCGAIASGLVESELFGHERGAFTGALQQRRGRFELADGGSIFLDEVGELPPETQVRLLRVLQEREFERVGGSHSLRVNVRVIAATNRDLREEVRAGRFRMDLYFRLNVFPLTLPPLRDRRADIPLLVEHFLARAAARLGKRIDGISSGTMERLLRHAWPGNVRELANVLERAAILADGRVLEVDALPSFDVLAPARGGTLEAVERAHITAVLEQTAWRISGGGGAATVLGMNPSTLRSRMQKLGIRREALRS